MEQDNEELSFISLAALTANVLRYLESDKQKQERTGDNAERGDADEKNSGADREYIERRLRDIAAFEKRAKGIIPHRLRRERK